MSVSVPELNRRSSRSLDVLDTLPIGVLEINAVGEILLANPVAEALFAPLSPLDFKLHTLLALSGAANGAALALAVATKNAGQMVRIRLSGGRQVDTFTAVLEAGGAIISLIEVTQFVREAELAARDPLTGLLNRASLLERLAENLVRVQRQGGTSAVLYVDLDRFKMVNDTLGHPLGDALLVKVSERLRSAVRQEDFVARLGGDEFIVLQTDSPQPNGAEVLSRRLVDLLGRAYVIDGNMLNIGASIGIACSPSDGNDPTTLIKHADLALYRAKAEGKGTFRFFQASMNAEMQARRQMEMDLRKALALKEFELAYQPQINLEADNLTGFEALIRWRHPERGFVSPADFIPLAEEIGLITSIGEWVLSTACAEAASWPPPISIAVNVSPAQFRDTKLVEVVESALAASGLDPQRLELEITEGTLLDNTEKVLSVLNALKSMGVQIAMDDFGTGYSSLSYLQKFPFDKIKIDGSFVRGLEGQSGVAIVKAVAALGASLGMKTTAEGVETLEQLARIRADGCSEVQGYLTGRPISAPAAAVLLAKNLLT